MKAADHGKKGRTDSRVSSSEIHEQRSEQRTHHDRRTGIDALLTTHKALSGIHGNGAYGVLAEVLGHLKN